MDNNMVRLKCPVCGNDTFDMEYFKDNYGAAEKDAVCQMCGFGVMSGRFRWITVRTDLLDRMVTEPTMEYLTAKHMIEYM